MQGGVISSTGSPGSSMDGAAGNTSSITATQPKPGTASGVVTVVSGATSGVDKPATTAVQTLNGSAVLMNCHVTGGSGGKTSQSAVTLVNTGPVSASREGATVLSANTITGIRTSSTSAQHVVISSQPSVKSVPTVTLVRPPMQTPPNPSHTVLTSPTSTTGSLINKFDSTKTIMQAVATGTPATMRSPTVFQHVRTSVPSTIAATPPAGIRAIAPQVLAPRLTQPQQNTPNIQNIQLPPGNFRV